MLLGNLYTALCSCLLIVICYVDADKCRLLRLLFSQHCSNCNVMLHVLLAIALFRSWSVFSLRNVALNACRVVGLCFVYAADFGVTPVCPLKLASKKKPPVAGLIGKRVQMIWRRCCYQTLEGSPCRHWQGPITSQHRHESHISRG